MSGVRSLLVGPYVLLVFVCSDMKGLRASINSHSYRLMAERHVLQQLLVCYVACGSRVEIHRSYLHVISSADR